MTLNTERYAWRVHLVGVGDHWTADLESRPKRPRAHWHRVQRGSGADPLEALRGLVAAVDEDHALRDRVIARLKSEGVVI